MSCTITQDIPAYVDGVEPKSGTFSNQDELLSIDWVKDFSEPSDRKFHRYSLAANHLMAEFDDGSYWWVIGRITYNTIDGKIQHVQLDLPKWHSPTNGELEKLR